MRCPRCPESALEAHDVHGIGISACPHCEGLLIPQNKLVPLLDAMTKGWADELDPDMEIEAHPDSPSNGSW